MSKAKGYPHLQPFCVNARPCQSKRNSWWNAASTSYWKDRRKAKTVTKTASVDTSEE